MFCKSCGTNISNYSNFCSSYGEEQNTKENCNINFDNINVNSFSGTIAMPSSSGGSILKTNYLEMFKTFFIRMAFVTLGAISAMNFYHIQ